VRRALPVVLLALAAAPLAAQRFVFGLAGAFGDYREVSNDLRFTAHGIGGSAVLTLGRFAAEASLTSLSYDPHESGTAADPFKATQFDGYLRYRVLRWASVEVGVTNRSVKDEFQFQAQSAAAWRLGVHSAAALGPYAGVAARLNYLAGAEFSGGGSSPFAVDVGLSFHYGVARGRLRFTGESEFQHFGRQVETADGRQDVPIQQVIGRLGLAIGF
jgi:hypothetical protein